MAARADGYWAVRDPMIDATTRYSDTGVTLPVIETVL